MNFHMSHKNRILCIIMIVSFINPFTGSALTLALPDIGLAYAASESQLGWVIEIFLISSTICIMPLGKAADFLGKRRIFLLGTLLFMVSSLAAPAVSSLSGLLLLRILQGIGSASIFATSLAILSLVYPPAHRGKAMGLTISAVYCGLSMGPVIGGWLNYYYGCQSIFYFIAFFCAVAAVLTVFLIKEEWIEQQTNSFDRVGLVVYAVSLIGILFGLSELLHFWYAKYVLTAGILLFAGFLYWETQQQNPLVPVLLFTQNRLFSCSTLAAMLNYCATFAVSFLLSLYLQRIMHFTSRDAGLILLIQPILMAVCSPFTGILSDRIPAAILSSAGMACISAGLAVLAYYVPEQSVSVIVACLIIMGIGFSLFTAPNNNAIMGAVPKKYYGAASSIVGTVRLIGQVFSVAIVTLILSRTAAGREDVLLHNIQLAFLIFTILCVLGIFPSFARRHSDHSNG